MFSLTRLALSAPRPSTLRLISSQEAVLYASPSLSSPLSHRTSPLSALPSSHPLLLAQGNVRTMGFWKELQKSLADEIAKEKKDIQNELEKERGEKPQEEGNKEEGNKEEGNKEAKKEENEPKQEEPKEQGPGFKEKCNETLQSSKEKFDQYLAQAREKADVAKQDFAKKYQQFRAPPPESSSTEPTSPEPSSSSSSSSSSTSSSSSSSSSSESETEQTTHDTTMDKTSNKFNEWREYLANIQGSESQNERLKALLAQYNQAKEKGKTFSSQIGSYFQKGVEEKDKALGAAKEQLKDSTITKQFETAKESAKKATQDTSSVFTDWVSQKKDEIQDSEVGKKTIEAKKQVEKFVLDPQPERDPHAGPIIADDEMKSIVEKEEALWRKQVRDLKGKVEGTKAYKAMSDAKIAIEDSDNPLVQRSLDAVDTISIQAEKVSSMVLGSSEEAQVLAEIDQYIPGFVIEEFLQTIVEHEGMVYTFLKAATARDFVVLRKMCTELNLKRHELIAEKTQDEIPPGTKPNLVITWIDLPELMQLSFHEATDNPQILINFNVQCYEEYLDESGNAELPESIKSVKYLWLLQFDPQLGWKVHEDAVGAREAIW